MKTTNGLCLVQHETRFDKRGNAVGVGYRGNGKRILPITCFYKHRSNGNMVCRVSTGDTWEVKQVPHPDYQFVTV